jgi:F-type H+-transporting ATPase subunit epsilon
MYIDVITPESTLFSADAKSVQLPGSDGWFGILDRHAPIISTLKKGSIKIIDANNQTVLIDVKSGVVEMNNNKLIILAEQ